MGYNPLTGITHEIRPTRKPISQISKCICPISHYAPLKWETCTFLFLIINCGIWNRWIMGFMGMVCYSSMPPCPNGGLATKWLQISRRQISSVVGIKLDGSTVPMGGCMKQSSTDLPTSTIIPSSVHDHNSLLPKRTSSWCEQCP